MPIKSAGILVFRRNNEEIEYLLGHPGGPYYKNRNEGVWTIPKGIIEINEMPLEAAQREFEEETGLTLQSNKFIELGYTTINKGKKVFCWAVEENPNIEAFQSQIIEIKFHNKNINFPELDELCWWNEIQVQEKIQASQLIFIERLQLILQA